jgi:hypothetical protein
VINRQSLPGTALAAMTSALLGRAAIRASALGACVAAAALIVPAPAAVAQTVEVTVKILEISCLADRGGRCLTDPSGNAPDYFAKIRINDGPQHVTAPIPNQYVVNPKEDKPIWEVKEKVIGPGTAVPTGWTTSNRVRIELHDNDSNNLLTALFNPDDPVDINPNAKLPKRHLDLKVVTRGPLCLIAGDGVGLVAACGQQITTSGNERKRAKLKFSINARVVSEPKVSALSQQE